MKGYNGTVFVNHDRIGRRDANNNGSCQVRACVQASSVDAVTPLLPGRMSAYAFRQYWHKALSADMEQALADHPPLTVLVKADRPGDTIDGSVGWVPL